VKTGTTTAFKDNWTLGFTPEVAVGVWVGNADGSSMVDVSGVDGAGPIWRDVMMAAAEGRAMSWPARPPGIVDAVICSPAGLLPGANCPSPVREIFVAGTAPVERESYYTRDADGQIAINPPVEAIAWAMDAGFRIGNVRANEGDGIRIVEPGSGSVLFVSPELRDQQLLLRASAPPGTERVTFWVDGRVAGEADPRDARLVWRLEPGWHQVEAVARLQGGGLATATSTYEVRTR
ncbi:MAG: hypothetical protein ABI782_11350, partial [Anaerolineaceae bacterium]